MCNRTGEFQLCGDLGINHLPTNSGVILSDSPWLPLQIHLRNDIHLSIGSCIAFVFLLVLSLLVQFSNHSDIVNIFDICNVALLGDQLNRQFCIRLQIMKFINIGQ